MSEQPVARPPDQDGPGADSPARPDVASRALGGTVLYANDEFFGDAHSLIDPRSPGHDPAAFGIGARSTTAGRPGGAGSPGGLRHHPAGRARHRPRRQHRHRALPGQLPAGRLGRRRHAARLPDRGRGAGRRLGPAGRQDRSRGGPGQPGAGHRPGPAGHPRPADHPPGRGRGAAAGVRRGGARSAAARRPGGPGRDLRGGRVTACSNMFFSSPANVLAPGRAQVMSDGWETARRRDDGHDWLVVRLAAPGRAAPRGDRHQPLRRQRAGPARLSDAEAGAELLPRTRLMPDTEHRFRLRPAKARSSRVRLDIYPDGGISRLRLIGVVPPDLPGTDRPPLARPAARGRGRRRRPGSSSSTDRRGVPGHPWTRATLDVAYGGGTRKP